MFFFKRKNELLKIITIISLLLFFLSFCSGNRDPQTTPGKGKKYVFFPPAPAKPRYQYLTTFSTSGDIEKKKSKFFNFIAGDETKKELVINKAHGVDAFRGIIYVCDTRGNVVVKLDLNKRKFGFLGYRGQGKLQKPINIKIDKKNKIIYVADMIRKQVLAYTLEGDLIRAYGQKKEFSPVDIDIKDNKLFICDIKAHQILVLDIRSGEILYRIGKKGRHRDGYLYHPSNIKVLGNKIYISDTTNFRISIFDIEGNFIDKIGSLGDRPGNFTRPKGIDVDREGRIYVVDASFQNIQIFNKDKKLLLYMLGPGRERYNLFLPAAITIDYENIPLFKKYISPNFKVEYILYVTNNFGKNKVNVYAFGKYVEK